MRLRHRRKPAQRDVVQLNLTSMIDVTFLLLLYFLVTTVLATPEDRLSPALQTRTDSSVGPTSDFQPQVVEVLMLDGAPAWRVGAGVMRDRLALAETLRGLHRDTGLFVKAYDDAPVGAVATAIQVAKDEGFEQVTYVPGE